jgi:phosphate transport system substrate-binding protein
MRHLAVLAALAVLPGCGGNTVSLSGRGATFVKEVMFDWADTYKDFRPVEVSYTGTGSSDGIQNLINGTVDFGCSDAPMTRDQLARARAADGEVLHIPLVIGAVVPAYNLAGIDRPLHFTGPVLADIFLGKVAYWDDPPLRDLNPGVALPHLNISVVTRGEGSGTTNIFTEYLRKVSDDFRTNVGAGTKPRWPVGQGQPGNEGVAGFIERTPGSLGYMELSHVLVNQTIRYGTVRNRAGKPVLASLESTTAAATRGMAEEQTVEPYSLHDLTYSLTDTGGEDAYPICGMDYMMLYKVQPRVKGAALVAFLRWATTDGQATAKAKGFAPLPADLVKRIDAKLNEVEYVP